MPQMLGPLDEYPLHQLPQPIAWPGARMGRTCAMSAGRSA